MKKIITILPLLLGFNFASTFSQSQLGQAIDGIGACDYSGASISLSADGKRVAIGATSCDFYNPGFVRVYEWTNNTWIQLGSEIIGKGIGDNFGHAVALSADGKRVAIGAIYYDGSETNTGHVRVYEWRNGTWIQLGADIEGEEEEAECGYSVSLSASGHRMAIGTPNQHSIGHVRVYEWTNEVWMQIGGEIAEETVGGGIGFSVSLSSDGNRLAIGDYV